MEPPGTGMRTSPAGYVLRALGLSVPVLLGGTGTPFDGRHDPGEHHTCGGGGAYDLVEMAGRGCDGILSSICM